VIKVSVFYPKGTDSKFDMEYYCEKHMSMVMERFGQRCKGVSVDEGLNGGAAGTEPAYLAVGHFLFDSIDDFQEAFRPHSAEIMSDVQNYTNVSPFIQVSQVRM
jgi:uncharacterized protein (TIGR02118 family)